MQAATAELAFGEFEFAGHARHVEASVAPTDIEYVPVKQSVHAALPLIVLYFPATQAVHGTPSGPVNPALQAQALTAELAVGELEFAGHARHVVAIVAPTDMEYVPDKQSVHAALPLIVLYFPATQEVHRPPSGPVKPMLHTQALTTELAFGELEFAGHARHVVAIVAPTDIEYVPAKQSVHVAVPEMILYLPETHAAHGPPSGPVKPTLQAQALIPELAFGELEFAGHARHVDASVAFVIVEYVPAAQSTHAALPALVLYFPATHATQGPPSGPVNPGLQAADTHALTFELPLGEVVPAGHETHTSNDCVVNLLYLMITTPEPPSLG